MEVGIVTVEVDKRRDRGRRRPPTGENGAGSAGLLLAQLGRTATRRYKAALAPSGLTPTQVALLIELRDRGPTGQQTLAAALDLDPNNLVALLNDAEADGLALRRRDPSDRRRHIVEISGRGADRLARAERHLAAADEQLFGDLGPAERREVQLLLSRVAESNLAAVEEPSDDEAGER
jgi:DNA-binding MarR family transcriptional regulator